MNENVQHLINATQALYHGNNDQQRQEADKWISKFQLSKEAWSAADQILSNVTQAGPEMHFIAAQTLNRKVRYDYYDQLDASSRQTLRDNLFKYLSLHTSAGNNQAVITQLALALAALALQMEEWTGMFSDLANKLGGSKETLPVLLEVFQVIPEEVGNRSLDLTMKRERYIKGEMVAASSNVLKFMIQCASSCGDNVAMQTKIFTCLASWVEFGDIPGNELASTYLLSGVFQALHSPALFDDAVSLLVEVFHGYPGNSPDDLAVIQIVVPQVFALRPMYEKAVADGDDDAAKGLARVFGHMSESYVDLLLGEQDMNQTEVLKLLLLSTSHPDFEIAQKGFYFWESLLGPLSKLEPATLYERRIAEFEPCLQQLAKLLVRRMKFPGDFNSFSKATQEDFYVHRAFAGDIMSCCSFIMKTQLLEILVQELDQGFNEMQANPQQGWQLAEAALFAVKSVFASFVYCKPGTAPSQIINNVLKRTLTTPATAAWRVRAMGLATVGYYAEWLHFNEPDLGPYINFIMEGFKLKETCRDASRALCDMCKYSKTKLAQLGIFQVVNAPLVQQLDSKNFCKLLTGLVEVVNTLDYDNVATSIQRLAGPAITKLGALVQLAQQQSSSGHPIANKPPAPEVNDALEVIIVFVRYVQFSVPEGKVHPSVALVQHIWKSIEAVALLYGNDELCVESIVKILKHAMRASDKDFEPMLLPMLQFIVSAYQRSPMSSYMYCGCVAVGVYYKDQRYVGYIVEMFQAFAQSTFTHLSNLDAFIKHPDFIEDLFLLAERCVTDIPEHIVQLPFFGPLFEYSIAAIMFDHTQANTAALYYITAVIRLAARRRSAEAAILKKIVNDLMQKHGKQLVSALIGGICGTLHESLVEHRSGSLSATLYELCCFYDGDISEYLIEAFKSPSCAHVNTDLAQFCVQNLEQAFFQGEDTFEDLITDLCLRARKRLLRNGE